uniref:band 4.1-like protein 4 n=1 Tax=Styela clava TaxID=7725 RepID=UPI00193A1AE6|nr:band 4.1-like protein 4 [Styela clava]
MLCCNKATTSDFSCEVILLDDTVLPFRSNIHFKESNKTQGIFDAVCDHLNLAERDYFGLRYKDKTFQTHWLDLYRRFRDHEGFIEGENPHKLHFGVKFYVADPTSLREEITRYQFFLQLKQDVLSGRLPCDFKKGAELAALVLQSELGDYQNQDHAPGYASEFRFIPNQDEEFENVVEQLHKGYSGLVPSEAELMYLRKCKQLDMYGLDIHNVKDEFGTDYIIGLSARGVEVRKYKRKVRIHYWPLINHIEFKDKQFKIHVKNKNCDDSVYLFITPSRPASKYLWKRSIEQHAFFRLVQSDNAVSSTSLLGKKFRYSGRTEAEMLHSQTDREEPEVLRNRSKRYPSRSSINTQENYRISMNPKRTENGYTSKSTSQSEVFKTVGLNGDQRSISDENLLERKGMFGTTTEGGISNNYITPKSERRERNRHLQSLSDSENKHRKTRSRHGKSSGEESDGPSRRRIRSRNRNRGDNSGSEGEGVRRRRRRAYHTDTEMLDMNLNRTDDINAQLNVVNGVRERTGAKTDGVRSDDGKSDTRSNHSRHKRTRKKMNRLSREDATAQHILWKHIQKEQEDPSNYTEEQLQDIPYTEIKTEGNPLPLKLRRHSRGHSSPGNRRSSSKSSSMNGRPKRESSTTIGDGLVSPLPVTTTVARDKLAVGAKQQSSHQHGGRHKTRRSPPDPMHDWDTEARRYSAQKSSSRSKHNSPNTETPRSVKLSGLDLTASTQV